MTHEAPADGFRTFLIVWITQSISVFGSALTFFAITIWLTQVLYPLPQQKSELALALSAVALAAALPIVFGAPLAGAWADRHDRRRIMLVMDVVSGVLCIILAAMMVTRTLQLGSLLVLTTLTSVAGSFHGAAFDTSYAMLVPTRHLPRANGMMQAMWALSGVLSPAMAAVIVSLPSLARQSHIRGIIGNALSRLSDGSSLAIALDALTFFIAALTLVFLSIPSPKRYDLLGPNGRKKSIWADVLEGARYIWCRRPLLWLLGTFAVANLVSTPMGVFQPLILKFNLAADWQARGFTFETAMALIGTVGGIGGVLGGFAVSAWGGLKSKRVYGVLVPLVIQGVCLAAFGFAGALYPAAGMVFVNNALLPLANAHSQSIWQAQTPHELQGRVFAVRRLIAQCTGPVSTALAGLAAGAFNPGTVMGILGVFLALFCAASMFNPQLQRVEDREWLDRMAQNSVKADLNG